MRHANVPTNTVDKSLKMSENVSKKFKNKECPTTRAHDVHIGAARPFIVNRAHIASSRDDACDYNGLMLIRFLALLT